MNSMELCFRILLAESEQEVDEIIESTSEMMDSGNWYPIDGRETNYNVVTNQAATGGKALTELCTNMVDAILLKGAHEQGINPLSADAPQSIIEGVKNLVRLPGAPSGVLSEADSETSLVQFARENLVIGVTGGTRQDQDLCFTFVDRGEGQHAEDFEDTFLSLSKGNKSDIPFVQGKYNMGSSGVLTYCGRRWYKLIVSRRFDRSADWGWTLVRRRPSEGKPVAEYFKHDGAIPTFESPEIEPIRQQSGTPDPDVRIDSGTIVKLYNYQMESAADFRRVREAINQNLISTVLPFRLSDYTVRPARTGRRGRGIDDRGVYGMEFLLLRRYGEDPADSDGVDTDIEPGFDRHVGDIEHPDLGKISVRAIVLGKKLPGWLNRRNNVTRVFHAVNGQIQFKQTRGYLSQTCRLPGLVDRVVIIVDASDLTEAAHNDVWKGDRETIRATQIGKLYQEQVTQLIARSADLRRLQDQFAQEAVEDIAQESQISLFQSLVNVDPSLASLLPGGGIVTLPGGIGPRPDEPEPYEGKYSPTFLSLVGTSLRENGVDIQPDGTRVIRFQTDVADDYFQRPDNRGRLIQIPRLSDRFALTLHPLHNGSFSVTLAAQPGELEVGQRLPYTFAVLDDAMAEPITEEVTFNVVETRPKTPPGGPSRPTGPSEDDGQTDEPSKELPPHAWLTRDGRPVGRNETTDEWPEGFTEQDGGDVQELTEDEMLYRINYDNAHFQRFLERERDDVAKRVITAQYRLGMLVFMMGIENAYRRMEEGTTKSNLAEILEDVRRLAAQGAASVVMSIAKTFPEIINPKTVDETED